MFEFIQRFFGKPASGATARERLRLVLLSDHLSLAPDVVEALKHDLIEVISRYVDVDAANCDVTFEQQDKQVAMLANIPILAMRTRPGPPSAPPPPPAAPPPAREPEPASPSALDLGGATAAVDAEPAGAPLLARHPMTVADAVGSPQPATASESVVTPDQSLDATDVASPHSATAADAAQPGSAKPAAPANGGGSRKRRRKRAHGAAVPTAT